MPMKYVAMIVLVWIVGSFMGAVLEDVGVPMDQPGIDEESILQRMTIFEVIGSEESWGVWDYVTFIPEFFGAVRDMLVWDFSFLPTVGECLAGTGGAWCMFRWFIQAPFMAMIIYGIVVTFLSIFQKVL